MYCSEPASSLLEFICMKCSLTSGGLTGLNGILTLVVHRPDFWYESVVRGGILSTMLRPSINRAFFSEEAEFPTVRGKLEYWELSRTLDMHAEAGHNAG